MLRRIVGILAVAAGWQCIAQAQSIVYVAPDTAKGHASAHPPTTISMMANFSERSKPAGDKIPWKGWEDYVKTATGKTAFSKATTGDRKRGFTIVSYLRPGQCHGDQTFFLASNLFAGHLGFTLKAQEDSHRFSATLLGDGAFSHDPTAAAEFTPHAGEPCEVSGVYDPAARQVRLYIDGKLCAKAAVPRHRRKVHPPMEIIYHVEIPTNGGELANLRFAEQSLTDAEIARESARDRKRFADESEAGARVAVNGSADSTFGAKPKTFTYSNPIYFQGNGPHDSIRDPQILRDGDTYYLVFTMWPFRNYTDRKADEPDLGSSPGILIYSSRDLTHWKPENWLLKSSELPDDCPYKHQFWAPELHKIGKRYYVIFGGSNWIDDKYNVNGHMGYYQFVGVADKITGPYSHFTRLAGPGVDTSLFADDDGKTYVIWPRNEVHPVDLSHIDDGIVTVGPKLSQAATPEDFAAIGKPAPETIEGPYMIKRQGTYYCFFAETYRGKDGFYDTGVATATSLNGPWKLDPRWRVFPGGHQAEFVGPDGRWWTAYKHEESPNAPWLNVDPIDFDAEGNVLVAPTTGEQSVGVSDPAKTRNIPL